MGLGERGEGGRNFVKATETMWCHKGASGTEQGPKGGRGSRIMIILSGEVL